MAIFKLSADPQVAMKEMEMGGEVSLYPINADEEGYVAFPRVNAVEELANLTSASRAFEANLVILRKSREMGEAAMRIGR